jgi:hypothetical protein
MFLTGGVVGFVFAAWVEASKFEEQALTSQR